MKTKKEKKTTKTTKKKKILLTDLIGPLIAIENILILLFYLWWNFGVVHKPGIFSYILANLMLFISIFLIILSIVSFIRLITNKEDLSKKLKREKTNLAVVGMILGLILLLFTDTIAGSIGNFKNPVKACDNPAGIINEIGIGGR